MLEGHTIGSTSRPVRKYGGQVDKSEVEYGVSAKTPLLATHRKGHQVERCIGRDSG